jgi:iron(III) transport system ATP-binding protein
VLLPGTAADGWATCALGRLPLAGSAPEGPVTVLVRPEQILLGTAGMPARVTAVTFYGHDAAIGLQLQAAPRLTLSARIAGHAIPHVGDAIAVSVAGPVLCFAEL